MRILGIETSCDETAAAVVDDGTLVRSSVIATSRRTFEHLSGVIPEQAARMQVECMIPIVKEALAKADTDPHSIDAIAVTKGPGLLGSLLVGTITARTLASAWGKPLIGVHHTFGHLSSTWLQDKEASVDSPLFPILTLTASGGHTDLWYRTSHTEGVLLGRTRDDAAGEAFDKGASLLGLPYPGGPSIAKAGETGNPMTYTFPLPLAQEDHCDFSFSGLKTSLKYLLRDLEGAPNIPDIAASYERGICLHLLHRLGKAVERFEHAKEVHLVGGVSANQRLRAMTQSLCDQHHKKLRVPISLAYCTDNAAMIAAAGFFKVTERGEDAFAGFETTASLPLEQSIAVRRDS